MKAILRIASFCFILCVATTALAQSYKGEVPVTFKRVANSCTQGSCTLASNECGRGTCCSSLFLPSCYSCACADPNCASNPCLSPRRLCSAFGNVGASEFEDGGCQEIDYY
jgi:hypothetical protein